MMKYETQWESIKLENDGDFPKYKDYAKSLSLTLEDMDKQLQTDTLPKLRKFYSKLFISKKYTEALDNFNKYGQPYES
jgi:hypothetical protein